MATMFASCKDFKKADFKLGAGEGAIMSPLRCAEITFWTNYYWHIINKPGQVVRRLLPLI